MAKKTFALEMKGVEIKTLENLRENFDLEIAVQYFKSGELLDWLEDRFYDDEAEKIENISLDDKNLSQKICAALGVDCDDDVEFIQRVREKKNILSEKTDDENIIDNAATTALNQDDLANLLHMDYSTIFLCGESFNVPIRVENKKYIGVLSTPKIKIRANSDAELAEKNISFENCQLPWHKASPIEELRALAQKIFGNDGKFPIIKNGEEVSSYDKLDKMEKFVVLRMIGQGKYQENQIAYMRLTEDLSAGFAFTNDSFCSFGAIGDFFIKYKDIKQVQALALGSYEKYCIKINEDYLFSTNSNKKIAVMELFGKKSITNWEKVKKFLDVVKNF